MHFGSIGIGNGSVVVVVEHAVDVEENDPHGVSGALALLSPSDTISVATLAIVCG